MVGGIIPLRRATSSRYDGRLGQESARRASQRNTDEFPRLFTGDLRSPVRVQLWRAVPALSGLPVIR